MPERPPPDNHPVLRHLRELIDAQLINAVTPEAFAFRHALTREAVYTTMLKRQRAALHALVAETLESTGGEAELPEHSAVLAYHYREAANWPKTLEYAQRAGEQALARYAPREAVEHFTRALEAAAQLGQTPDRHLLRGRGQACETLGEFERARADYERSLSLAQASGAAPDECQALVDLGVLWAGIDYGHTGEYFQQALTLARATGDPLTIAHSLNRMGNWLNNAGQPAEGLRYHRQALEICQALAAPAELATTYELLGLTFGLVGDLQASQDHFEQAIALLRGADDKRALIASLTDHSALVTNCDTLPWRSPPLPVCRAEAQEALALSRQIGWLAGEIQIQWLFGCALVFFGEFGEALAWTTSAEKLAGEIQHREWTAASQWTLGMLYLDLLQPELAQRWLHPAQRLAAELRSSWWINFTSVSLALAHAQLGQFEAARAELRQAAAALSLADDWPEQPPRNLLERNLTWAWAETALAAGQPAEALPIVDRLIDTAINPRGEPIPNLLRLKAEALLALDETAAAQTALDEALAGARQHQIRPILWQVHRDRARLAERLGRPDDARREQAAARTVVEALAGTLDQGALKQAFLSRAMGAIGNS